MGNSVSFLADKVCEYLDNSPFFCKKEESANSPQEVSYCDEIGTDNFEAYELCELLREEGFTKADIDTGLEGKIFRPPQYSALPNNQIEPQEVYYKAMEVMGDEIYFLGKVSPGEEKDLFSYKAWWIGFRLPWLIYDGNPLDNKDEMERIALINKVGDVVKNDIDGSMGDAADDLFEMCFDDEGLGVVLWNDVPKELSLVDTLLTSWGDCSETSRLFYSVYHLAGFDPEFVWVKEDLYGDPLLHVAVKIDVGKNDVIVDSHYGFGVEHQSIEHLPLLSVLALYYNNLSIEETDDERARAYLEKSLGYDPTYSLTYLYLSLPRFNLGNEDARRNLIGRAQELDPESHLYLELIQSPAK